MTPLKQILLFCLVGVMTTAIDFLVFNLLTRPALGWRRIPANLVSVTCAMIWSFLANWQIVFQSDAQDWLGRAGRFLITTAFSAFVLQNLVLYWTTSIWQAPTRMALSLVGRLRLKRPVDPDLISRNTCKTMAVSAGLVWNFCWYKFFVYAV
ncbi:MAG: GtrA family protein [Verrucomicrobiales bacterium]|nr:GtrA family protein [Verrucomicrobiales bacterium]